jgi:hypothetical protein
MGRIRGWTRVVESTMTLANHMETTPYYPVCQQAAVMRPSDFSLPLPSWPVMIGRPGVSQMTVHHSITQREAATSRENHRSRIRLEDAWRLLTLITGAIHAID